VADSLSGWTDAFGREMSTTQALTSAFGVKLGSYSPDVLRRNLNGAAEPQVMEIEKNIANLKRQRQAHQIDRGGFEVKVKVEQEKRAKVLKELADKL
jgi:hypothetical protein